jgi:hypothetical protein
MHGMPVSKNMKTAIDFLKILSDIAPFPNFVGEKQKIKSIDGRLLAYF